ncbi:MAG: hypothetical protein ACXVCP_14675 [Bdellovibrio sp.]
MNRFSVVRMPVVLLLYFAVMGCSNTQENSLLSDKAQDPSNHTVDKTAKVEELYIRTYSGGASATNLSKVEVSGECYTSTFPSSNIVALENNQMLDMFDLNPNTDVNTPQAQCKNGRFNVAINTGNLSAGAHTVKFVVQARDSNNAIVTNPVQGVSTFQITK